MITAYITAYKYANICAAIGRKAGFATSNIYDFSNENWTVVDADAKIIELYDEFVAAFPEIPFTQQHIIFPAGVQISYLAEVQLNTILAEETENSIELTYPILADTDAIIKWYADWVEENSITQTQIDMDAYDACTAASETDMGRFATENNENSFINLEILQ